MAKPRSYKLLCPIARALDRIGDRWTLLILRDLHAGPARFTDLQKGLTGIAANLLADRLVKLTEDGLAEKSDGGHGVTTYRLTALGERTLDIVFELAVFGAQFAPEEDIVTPGNLRTVATTLRAAARRVDVSELGFDAAMVVDGEQIRLRIRDGKADVTYAACPDPDVVFSIGYADLLGISEGEPDTPDRHSLETRTPGKDTEFLTFMSRITRLLRDGDPATA